MKKTYLVSLLLLLSNYLIAQILPPNFPPPPSLIAAVESETVEVSPYLNLLSSYMIGSFNSYQQSVDDEAYYNISLEMHPIWAERTDGIWLYVEQAMATAKHRPYRQRVYHLTERTDGKLESAVFKLPQPQRFILQWNNDALFAQISPDSLILREGCSIILERKGDAFIGTTGDQTCGSKLRGASYATSKVTISEAQLDSWDQGFNEAGEQVWGAEKGPYQFVKQPHMVFNYPDAKRDSVVENYFGTKVADPYRWLEDENNEDTKHWIAAQNKLTDSYFDQISFKPAIEERLKALWNYPKYGTPTQHGDYYYFFKNDGIQNHAVYYRQKGLTGESEVFLDPNTFSKEGSSALVMHSFSKDHRYMAYGISEGGSDWRDFFVMDVATKERLPDHLKHIKFSGASWLGDGFFYSRYDLADSTKALSEENDFRKIYYHKVGTPQSEDILVYEDAAHPHRSFWMSITNDEAYLILSVSDRDHQGNALYIKPTENWQAQEFKPIVESFEHSHWVVDHKFDHLLINTNQNAPKRKLVVANITAPDEPWIDIIPEQENVLKGVYLAADKIVLHYMQDVSSRIDIYNVNGTKEKEIELPTLGILNNFSSQENDSIAFYTFSSFLHPPTIYQYNFNTDSSTLFQKPAIDFPFDEYETKQVFYHSKDSTKIPMFITHKKGLKLNGHHPVLLYGYGGFNISRIPEFKVANLPFYESGGVYAVANLRGGSEYGEEWHQAGMLEKKQNVFDDFIAAAEYLIDEGYTNKDKLAATGRSNGGLLIGTVANQRPDLFKAVLPVVGVMDMLRYQKFTIGWAWTKEYGSSDDSTQFSYLHKYSPYHNISADKAYPAIFTLTAERDDRVVPAHSYKYTAALQHHYQGNNPLLIRVEKETGHGSNDSGRTFEQNIQKYTERWAFIFHELGLFPK